MLTLRDAREDAGMSQRELAAASGVPSGTLFNWESGRCQPRSGSAMEPVAFALGVPVRQIICG